MPQELRFALRSLLRSPGFLITAVGSLAIAIGASVAAFSVIDAVRLRALPFIDADRLVIIGETPTGPGTEGTPACRGGCNVSYETFAQVLRTNETEVAAHFTVTDPIRGLRVRLPSLAAMVLERPVLSIVGEEGSITNTLADHAPALQSLRWEGTDLVVEGDAEPILELPRLVRDKPTTLTLTAGCRCVPPRWLRELVLGTAGASALATDDPSSRSSLLELRWRCFAGCRIRVRAVRDGVEPGAGIEVPLQCNTDPTSQVARFSATFEIPAAATAVDLVLPAGIQATFSDLQLDGTLDTTLPRAHDLEATNGEWHASGPSPELRYTFARALRPTLCTWRGSVR